jgi:hypothetical protein
VLALLFTPNTCEKDLCMHFLIRLGRTSCLNETQRSVAIMPSLSELAEPRRQCQERVATLLQVRATLTQMLNANEAQLQFARRELASQPLTSLLQGRSCPVQSCVLRWPMVVWVTEARRVLQPIRATISKHTLDGNTSF